MSFFKKSKEKESNTETLSFFSSLGNKIKSILFMDLSFKKKSFKPLDITDHGESLKGESVLDEEIRGFNEDVSGTSGDDSVPTDASTGNDTFDLKDVDDHDYGDASALKGGHVADQNDDVTTIFDDVIEDANRLDEERHQNLEHEFSGESVIPQAEELVDDGSDADTVDDAVAEDIMPDAPTLINTGPSDVSVDDELDVSLPDEPSVLTQDSTDQVKQSFSGSIIKPDSVLSVFDKSVVAKHQDRQKKQFSEKGYHRLQKGSKIILPD